jgi:hypothetical protein
MIHSERALVMDIVGTLCEIKRPEQSYLEVAPKADHGSRSHAFALFLLRLAK